MRFSRSVGVAVDHALKRALLTRILNRRVGPLIRCCCCRRVRCWLCCRRACCGCCPTCCCFSRWIPENSFSKLRCVSLLRLNPVNDLLLQDVLLVTPLIRWAGKFCFEILYKRSQYTTRYNKGLCTKYGKVQNRKKERERESDYWEFWWQYIIIQHLLIKPLLSCFVLGSLIRKKADSLPSTSCSSCTTRSWSVPTHRQPTATSTVTSSSFASWASFYSASLFRCCWRAWTEKKMKWEN